jgi:transcriptional regulator with XRE-family HTH domain
MDKAALEALSKKLIEKRGDLGVRETARDIGISHATLSRVERGYLPDLDTFEKICKWLRVDPAEFLGIQPAAPKVAVHFRKKTTLAPATAKALTEMIIAAHKAFSALDEGQE